MSELKKYNKSVIKHLVKAQPALKFLNCPAGCHKNHVALFDRGGNQLTAASDDPVKVLSLAAQHFSEFAAFLTKEQALASEDKKSESDLPAELSELVELLASVFGPDRVKIKPRSAASENPETDQTAG